MAKLTESERFGDTAPLMVQLVNYAGGSLRLVNTAVAEARRPDGHIHLADIVQRIDALSGREAVAQPARTGD